jgi:Predicted integral membrane protein
LILRGTVNRPLPALVSSRAEVMVQKTVIVHAPIHKVFDLWSQFENYPRFMRHVRDIDVEVGGRKTAWIVDGPAGTTVNFEAETIELEPDRVIAWRTLPAQPIEHEGRIRFEEVDDGTTRVTVRMTYRPPGGVLGHAIAHILGWDPKSRIDDDIVRMKSLLEDGKVRPGGERPGLFEFH